MKRLFGFITLAFLMAMAYSPPVEAAKNTYPVPAFDAVQVHQVNMDAQEAFVTPVDYSLPFSFTELVMDEISLQAETYQSDMRLYDSDVGLGLYNYEVGGPTNENCLVAQHTIIYLNSDIERLEWQKYNQGLGYNIAFYKMDVGWSECQNLTVINNWQNLNDERLYKPVVHHKRQTCRRTKFLNG